MPGNGHYKPDAPQHDQHMKNFDTAMKDALKRWEGGEQKVKVTLEATVTPDEHPGAMPNPGGIKEYFVTLSP